MAFSFLCERLISLLYTQRTSSTDLDTDSPQERPIVYFQSRDKFSASSHCSTRHHLGVLPLKEP